MTLCCARGSAKRPGSRSNGSLKSEGAAMASYYQRRGRSGVLSTRKPAGLCACRRKCASSFQFDLHERRTRSASALKRERRHRGSGTQALFRTWTPNIDHLLFRVEYHTRVTPGYRLLLRDVSQTGDAAYLPANSGSETMRSRGDRAEARKRRALSL